MTPDSPGHLTAQMEARAGASYALAYLAYRLLTCPWRQKRAALALIRAVLR